MKILESIGKWPTVGAHVLDGRYSSYDTFPRRITLRQIASSNESFGQIGAFSDPRSGYDARYERISI